ncbi:MAG: glycosyltransferase [Ornithinimicrobium sp.]
MSLLVLAVLGTDHHPFDRLISWMDAAATQHPDVRFVVQHGASRPPSVAEGADYLTHDLLVEMLAMADVVVCHGGPGTITDARGAGHRPICVPRDPALGEHVDGHQRRFASVVGPAGLVEVTEDREGFDEVLAQRLSLAESSDHVDGTTTAPRSQEARRLLADELDELWQVGAARRRRTGGLRAVFSHARRQLGSQRTR